MVPERKKAFEIFRRFDAVGMNWKQIHACCVIYLSGVKAVELKHGNTSEVEFLEKVEREMETI